MKRGSIEGGGHKFDFFNLNNMMSSNIRILEFVAIVQFLR